MKDRGKAVETSTAWLFDSSENLPCRKHPYSSSVGICAFCLKDRLIKLVCSDCGEQRLSSCSCSDISSNRNSCSVDVGSVGRISFLIENEKAEAEPTNLPKFPSNPKPLFEEKPKLVMLKRSNSSCADYKKMGFWNLASLFKKKRDLGPSVFHEKGEIWVGLDGKKRDFEGSCSVNIEEILGSESSLKRGSFSGSERVFGSVKKVGPFDSEGGFNGEKDSGFIDLKLGFKSEAKHGLSRSTESGLSAADNDAMLSRTSSNGRSCLITINESGIKRSKKGMKVWKWIFGHSDGRRAK